MRKRRVEENRTRVTCHLPGRDAQELKAFKSVIAYLKNQRTRHIGMNGYTVSDPGAFMGYWWDSKKRRWVEDTILLLMVDYKVPLSHDSETVPGLVSNLKTKILSSYKRYKVAQDEVWLVTHRITRH